MKNNDIDLILETMGQIFYDYGLVGRKKSWLAGSYQLPLSPDGDPLLVGPWLKIKIDTKKLPDGVFLDDLIDERLLTALRSALGRNVETRQSEMPSPILSAITEAVTNVDHRDIIPVEFWYFVELDSDSLHGIPRFIPFDNLQLPGDYQTLPIPLGFSPAGKFEWFDMSHIVGLLVAGATRTGKSVWLRSVLRFLSDNFPVDYFRAALVDLKFGVEFGQYSTNDQFSIYTDPPSLLSFVEDETISRFKLFKKSGCYSILDYNKKQPEDSRLPYWLIVIDEYAAFSRLASKPEVKQAEQMVAQSAGAGLYWLIATQRPSVDVITGVLKANLGSRLSFSLASTVDAKVVFDVEDFSQVVGIGCPGRGWAIVGDRTLEFQSVFTD